jgi:hypothetical protein
MERQPLTPFEELHAMLTFDPTTPLSTVGEVMIHLQNARVSLAINARNLNDAKRGSALLLNTLLDSWGPDATETVMANKMIQHIEELAAAVDLAITRDIVVMETWLRFMQMHS